jgi:hypothetical protein
LRQQARDPVDGNSPEQARDGEQPYASRGATALRRQGDTHTSNNDDGRDPATKRQWADR